MNYYVTIKHPVHGGPTHVVPTGKTTTEERTGETMAEGLSITPRSNLTKVWFRREDIVIQ